MRRFDSDFSRSRRRFCRWGLGAMTSGIALGDTTNLLAASRAEGTLKEKAERSGRFFGAAVVAKNLLADASFRSALRRDCSFVVPDSELKWSRIQKGVERSLADYSDAEAIYRFAVDSKLSMRGHTLVWHRANPPWVLSLLQGRDASSVAERILVEHVDQVVRAWRGRLPHWDVVNEPLSAPSGSVWTRLLGERYIDISFQAARAADPSALLVLNQDLIEMDDSYQDGLRSKFLKLIERLLKRGVPLDCIGIEGHLNGGLNFSQGKFSSFLREIDGFGLKFIITEFDVWDGPMKGGDSERDLLAASLVENFLDVSFSFKSCLGALTWTLTDLYSWYRLVPEKHRADGALNRSGLLDANYMRKPMWDAVARSFDRALPR